jgi:peptidoglycan hydrolase-like amidase
MALRGKKFDEILHHYYSDVEINDLSATPVASASGR